MLQEKVSVTVIFSMLMLSNDQSHSIRTRLQFLIEVLKICVSNYYQCHFLRHNQLIFPEF